MDPDIFFDCPQCHHTIKVSSDLVGVEVQCPDCANEFEVPDIRDGRNPRLRSKTSRTQGSGRVEIQYVAEKLEELEEELGSLLRRQQEQIKEIDFLGNSAHLIFKQLGLLSPTDQESPVLPCPPLSGDSLQVVGDERWLRWSQVFGWVTLGMTILVGVLLLSRTL